MAELATFYAKGPVLFKIPGSSNIALQGVGLYIDIKGATNKNLSFLFEL